MNTNQKKYALNRVEALRDIKLREAGDKYTTDAVTLSKEEKYKLIASGAVKIKPFNEINSNYSSPDLYPSFDFSKYEKPKKIDTVKYEAVSNKIIKLAQDTKDQIMLGDCQEALKLITTLENIVV